MLLTNVKGQTQPNAKPVKPAGKRGDTKAAGAPKVAGLENEPALDLATKRRLQSAIEAYAAGKPTEVHKALAPILEADKPLTLASCDNVVKANGLGDTVANAVSVTNVK